jgi:hypothetical protein
LLASPSHPGGARAELAATIDAIEQAYEYMLAYAAQGRRDDVGSDVRDSLTQLRAALERIGSLAHASFASAGAADAGGAVAAYLDAVQQDARIARGAVELVLQQPRIASLLVDNLNASVHLRALLTDAFLLDQALQGVEPPHG